MTTSQQFAKDLEDLFGAVASGDNPGTTVLGRSLVESGFAIEQKDAGFELTVWDPRSPVWQDLTFAVTVREVQ